MCWNKVQQFHFWRPILGAPVNKGNSYKYYILFNSLRKKSYGFSFGLYGGYYLSFRKFFWIPYYQMLTNFVSTHVKMSEVLCGQVPSCIKQYRLVMLRLPTSGSKWCSSNFRYFISVPIPSMNIGPINLLDDMAHHIINFCGCSGETTLRWEFSVTQWHQFCLLK